jgi:poly-gamma-glutamate synthase PgsB/CapB
MLTVTVILASVICLLILEKRMIQRNINYLSLRIHVNGTRGKSSVTEYIAAGIDSSGQRVIAKITGIIPTLICDGTRKKINRYGTARVQEQLDTIRLARRNRVKNMVLECMSVAPELQKLEASVFQPHLYIITNIKDDHRESMGKSLEEQADAICSAIPANCKVITGERQFFHKIKEKANARNSTVIAAEETDPYLNISLPPGVFRENIAIALTVCREAGIEPDMAIKGIVNCILNSESPLITVKKREKTIRFLNAFSVNDADSTSSFIEQWKKALDHQGAISIIFNTRADRPIRTEMLSGWIASQNFERLLLTGSHIGRAKSCLKKAGVEKHRMEVWGKRCLHNLKADLIKNLDDGSLVVGLGNIGGEGFNIINELK